MGHFTFDRVRRMAVRTAWDRPGDDFLWFAETRSIAGSLGTIFVLGALCAVVQYEFSTNHFRHPGLFTLSCVVWVSVGMALLLGLFDKRPIWWFKALLFAATGAISVAVYAAGAPGAGMFFYYLWATPYAYVFFSRAQAAAQMAFVTLCTATVELVQIHQHPSLGPASSKIPLILGVVTSLLVIGTLARRLTGNAREADNRFRRGFDYSPVGLGFVSPDGRWLEVNDAMCEILGRARSDVVGTPVASAFAGEIPLNPGRSEWPAEFSAAVQRPGGEEAWAAGTVVPVRAAHSDGTMYLQVRDVTDTRRDREALLRQARHDPLTGLPNRVVFLDRLSDALSADPGRTDLAVVLVDFDRFKIINDSLGHHVGDELLVTVTPRLSAALVPGDLLARLGGDEFVVLCGGVTSSLDALQRASNLLQSLAEPVELTSGSHVVSASIGVALAEGPASSVPGLLANADAAMYRAKALGRGRIEMFDSEVRTHADQRLRLEHDLRTALRQGQFFLEYQPVVDGLGRTVAMEALVRWDSPEHGVLGPDEFIALAEETGLVCELGDWVLDTACTDLARWQADATAGAEAVTVAVNVSARQLSQADFVERVGETLRRSGVVSGTVSLEITESVLAAPDQAWGSRLRALKDLGTRLLLDDFGTGYSSLAYLKRFPVDGVKIDRSFVHGLGAAEETAIVEAVIRLAEALQLEVVAEGVEREDQLLALRDMGCDLVQGFLISEPLPADQAAMWLAGRGEVSIA